MTVKECAGECQRLISASVVPGGNPIALADPKHWAVDYVECPSCGRAWCDRCHTKLGSDSCPYCHQSLTHPSVANAPARPAAEPATTAEASSRRGWFRKRRTESRETRQGAQPNSLLARTFAEAQLFMELWACPCGGEPDFDRVTRVIDAGGSLAPTYSEPCPSCGSARAFSFRLPEQGALPGEDRFGDGSPSELLDPGEWMWAANRFAGVPPFRSGLDEDERRRSRLRVALAAAAMDEVLAFVPARKSAVPTRALRSERGRAKYAQEPLGSFRRERLEVVRDTYRQIVGELS